MLESQEALLVETGTVGDVVVPVLSGEPGVVTVPRFGAGRPPVVSCGPRHAFLAAGSSELLAVEHQVDEVATEVGARSILMRGRACS